MVTRAPACARCHQSVCCAHLASLPLSHTHCHNANAVLNATFKLACMLADGEGVARDDKEAAKLLVTAVSKGCSKGI